MMDFKLRVMQRGLASLETRRGRDSRGRISYVLWLMVLDDLRDWLIRRN